MLVVSTITSTLDPDTMETTHKIEIDDQDGLSEVHPDVLGAVLIGGLRASEKAVLEMFPAVAALPSAKEN